MFNLLTAEVAKIQFPQYTMFIFFCMLMQKNIIQHFTCCAAPNHP